MSVGVSPPEINLGRRGGRPLQYEFYYYFYVYTMLKVNRALISVSDKKGLIPFAKGLNALGVEII